jgi:MFS family permease
MIGVRLVVALSLSQFICWGISFYMIAVFGPAMGEGLGWNATLIYGGFSGALVVMALSSGWIGQLLQRHGGARIMTAGSCLMVLGFAGLALTREPWLYTLSWGLLGLAMRMTLYEAAFAAMARIAGPAARRQISQVTLLGGLASSAFWPIGHLLIELFGWRGALWCYAGFALLTVPLHLSIPGRLYQGREPGTVKEIPPLATSPADKRWAAILFVAMTTPLAFVNSGLSAHMIGVMSALGLSAGAAVWLSALRGAGQSAARLAEIAFGAHLSPLALGVVALSLMSLSFVVGLAGGDTLIGGAVFSVAYGAGMGLLTIVRGTQPLVLFDVSDYAVLSGKFAAPGFFVAALAPLAYAAAMQRAGAESVLYLSLGLSLLGTAAALMLWLRFRQ